MSVKIFSPDMRRIPKEKNLEAKMVKSDVIMPADVKDYANEIVDHLKSLKNSSEDERKLFVVNALSDDGIEEKVFDERKAGGNLLIEREEGESAIKRVRQALIEELKGKIDEKFYLVKKDAVRRGAESARQNSDQEAKASRKNIISEIVDVRSGIERIYKDQEIFNKEYKDYTIEALEIFKSLPPHPNLVSIKEYDLESHKIIFEKLNVEPLNEYLLEDDDEISVKLANSLQVLKDCMEGIKYLVDNGLVLGDIKLDNLGLETKEDKIKGVLFDLEGLVRQGVEIDNRIIGRAKYLPPEFLEENRGWEMRPSEMIYQLGVSLQEILEILANAPDSGALNQDVIVDLSILSKKMTRKSLFWRIGLSKTMKKLEKIIDKLK